MNKSNVRQKRSLGKVSPLSKRPKLDFTTVAKDSSKCDKYQSKGSPKGCNGAAREKISENIFGKNLEDNAPIASDWDDDFSGDMLEKVCLIADLSQAMVTNQSPPNKCDKEKTDFEIIDNDKVTLKPKLTSKESENNYKKLKLEIENLKDKLKTKEGEVHILRSQLKQNEDAKQTVALQNVKVLEELQKKCNEKISVTEKELESTKSKLLFRDLEYKTLSERCRQLEYNLSKNKLGETLKMAKPLSLSQTAYVKPHCIEMQENSQNSPVDNIVGNISKFEFLVRSCHEGKSLMRTISPEFFQFINETNVVPLYNSHGRIDSQRAGVNFGKVWKYKWNNLPKQKIFIKDLCNSVSSLFICSSFSHKDAMNTVQTIFEHCCEILTHQKKVLLFLEELQLHSDHDEADHSLLENEEEVKLVTLKNLIDGVKLNDEECGIEGRRSLALICSLMKVSEFAFKLVKSNLNFFKLLRRLSAAIGALRRPLRYNGILIGITLILQKVLQEKNLTNELLTIINQIVEELIFARPELNVLREIVNVLAAGKHHLDFLVSLCRVESVDSCTLYMDCKLKQVMFFTKNACPLKLLCMQIMGLASLPLSKSLIWEVTSCIIKWLNNSMNTPTFKKIKWLPINSVLMQEDRCFNVTECLLYLLTLCLKDYNLNYAHQEQDLDDDDVAASVRSEMERKSDCVSIIAQGAVLLKRILKVDTRQVHDNIYYMRFAVLLKTFLPSKSELCQKTHMNHMTSVQIEAISWITDLIESDFGNADYYLKHNATTGLNVDVFDALKINDDSKIF